MGSDPLQRLVPALVEVPGIEAVVLGGSRARGTAQDSSDYDIGLYFSAAKPLDISRLNRVARELVDEPEATEVTPVGGWGPWIVGGAWLKIDDRKVDLLYRNLEAVNETIESCCLGEVSMNYQAGHPHGFCSAIWMGEIAQCRPLHDPYGTIAALKAKTAPYPRPLRDALIRRFQWEILFSIENAEIAVSRGEQTHIAGCAYRAIACIGQVLFALNERYLINEKGALQEAATFPLTVSDLTERTTTIWQLIGEKKFAPALLSLHGLAEELLATARLGEASQGLYS